MATIKSNTEHKFQWTEEREQFVKDFYGKPSYTGESIATRLGCSRESVIGKASRLGLTRTKPNPGLGHIRAPARFNRAVTVDGTALAVTSRNERMGGMGSFRGVPARKALIDVPDYRCVGVPDITALEPHQCRWPLDASGFCGNDKYRGERHKDTSYCLTHMRASVSPYHYRGGYWATHK